MPVFAAHQNLAYPQLHEDSIPELAFWRAMSKLMTVCGVNDFTREDLARPDPKRLRKQLSGLINFAKFREERMELYQRITLERDEHLDRLATVEQENAQLAAQLEELKVATKAQREEIKALDDETAATAAKVNAKNGEQSALRQEAAELKKANGDLKEQIEGCGLEHAGLLGEIKKLQGQVVHSPERVRREMHESQRALQQERREGEAAEAAALVATTAAKAASDAVSKVNDATSAVGDILDLSNKCIEVGQQIKTREAAIEQNRKDAGEVAEAAAELERQNARLAEKLSSWEASAEEKAAAAASANEELREKLLEQRRRKATAAAAHGDEDRACEALTARIEAESVEQRRKLAELGAAWQRLEATVQAQQRALLAACAGGGLAGGAAQASGAPPAPTWRASPTAATTRTQPCHRPRRLSLGLSTARRRPRLWAPFTAATAALLRRLPCLAALAAPRPLPRTTRQSMLAKLGGSWRFNRQAVASAVIADGRLRPWALNSWAAQLFHRHTANRVTRIPLSSKSWGGDAPPIHEPDGGALAM